MSISFDFSQLDKLPEGTTAKKGPKFQPKFLAKPVSSSVDFTVLDLPVRFSFLRFILIAFSFFLYSVLHHPQPLNQHRPNQQQLLHSLLPSQQQLLLKRSSNNNLLLPHRQCPRLQLHLFSSVSLANVKLNLQ
jgi:hypothetical protein